MSEQTTPVRTDELAPGDRVWHPFDAVCFTVSHTPRPETGLHFEGEPGLRVTGTTDRGETVHVDVAPAYRWHRGPEAATTASAPLVVNTTGGWCWKRREATRDGQALYALADAPVDTPEYVMATYDELEHLGIEGSAFVVPAPVGPEPEADPIAAARRLDLLALMDEHAASQVSPVLAALLDRAEALRARVADLEALAGAATEYRLDEPGYGLLVRRAPGPDRSGWAVLESRRTEHGRRAWTTSGWSHSVAAEELFCWPSAEVAVAEARRVMPGAVVRDEGDVTPQVQRLRALLAGQREQQAGGPVEWCTGCNTDHNPDECGYRPGAGDAS